MSPINAPNCISCGLGGVYHRVTSPKPWRCRTCGSEFSDDDLEQKKKEEDRREAEARQAGIKRAKEARRTEEARLAEEARLKKQRQEEEITEYLYEHGSLLVFHNRLSFHELTAYKKFEARIGRNFTNKEFEGIYDDLVEMPNREKTYENLDRVFKIHTDDPTLREKPGNSPVRWILAAMVTVAIIYACF